MSHSKKSKKRKYLNNCEICEDCIYICEGDFICDKYGYPVLVKEDWCPTEFYSDCKACENYTNEEE